MKGRKKRQRQIEILVDRLVALDLVDQLSTLRAFRKKLTYLDLPTLEGIQKRLQTALGSGEKIKIHTA